MRSLEDYVGGLIDGVVRTPLASTLSRCIVDVRKRSVRFQELSAEPCELPRVAPAEETSAHRLIYAAGFANETSRTSGIFDALKKFDATEGRSKRSCWATANILPRLSSFHEVATVRQRTMHTY
jgi:carotenoid cleavage dioxygenase-like enzyme